MKVWQKTEELSEGKYLVVRRDGTVPWWPSFIMGGHDPAAAAGLRGYADKAEALGYEAEYVASVRSLADDYETLAAVGHPADPEAPPHRVDNPVIIAMMRGEGDLSGLTEAPPVDPEAHQRAAATKAAQKAAEQ